MWIDANFECGNIEVLTARDASNIELEIRPDAGTNHLQWFYFRVLGAVGKTCAFAIRNARDASFPEAWPEGSIVFSHDRKHWQRQETIYDGETLKFDIACKANTLYVALSAPYTADRHQRLLVDALSSTHCQLRAVVPSVENRPVEILQIGTGGPKVPNIWIIARQHPGEPMSEWYVEGVMDRLLDPTDPLSNRLRQSCCFFIVPNMNPDGTTAGNIRTNSTGVDLNRTWACPCLEKSPEVFGVLQEMDQTGVDLFLDVHGDEELALVFAAGCEGNPNFTNKMATADARFREMYHNSNPHFSTENGYPSDKAGEGDLSIACNQIGQRFGCLSLTIEMPFKDNNKRPNPVEGWSASQSKALGASSLTAIATFFEV